jgi:hypothetical protein
MQPAERGSVRQKPFGGARSWRGQLEPHHAQLNAEIVVWIGVGRAVPGENRLEQYRFDGFVMMPVGFLQDRL